MTLKHTYALLMLAGCMLVFESCNNSSSEQGNSSEASNKVEVPKVKMKDESVQLTIQDASVAQHLELPSGSLIDIPANAFVDASGNPVKGKIKLNFKEYHDAADIILGGIPMEYDTAGTRQVLQTAGMFNVTAFSGNEVLQIADGKEIQVSLISEDDGTAYNFYNFDEKTGNWVYTGASVNKPFHLKNETAEGNDVPRGPISPKAYNPNAPVIDMDINVDDYPELASLRGLMWQYAGTDASKDPSDAKNNWVFKHTWKKISVDVLDPEQSTFTLTLSDGKSSYQTIVSPVLSGKAFEKAMAKYNKERAAYEEKYAEGLYEKEKQTKIYRVFGISRVGIYNCDKIYNSSMAISLDATIITDDPEFGKKDSDIIYMVSGGMRTVYRMKKKDWSQLRFVVPDDKALVAVLSDGRVAVFSNEDFKLMKPEDIKGGKYTFTLKTVRDGEMDAATLRSMIKG